MRSVCRLLFEENHYESPGVAWLQLEEFLGKLKNMKSGKRVAAILRCWYQRLMDVLDLSALSAIF